jgi:hypothetical protein
MAEDLAVVIRASTAQLRADMQQAASTVRRAPRMGGAIVKLEQTSAGSARAVIQHQKEQAAAFREFKDRALEGVEGVGRSFERFKSIAEGVSPFSRASDSSRTSSRRRRSGRSRWSISRKPSGSTPSRRAATPSPRRKRASPGR